MGHTDERSECRRIKDDFMEVVEKMKKATKRLLAVFLALAMVFTLLAVPATSMKDVSAATSKKVYFYPSNGVVTYKPGSAISCPGRVSSGVAVCSSVAVICSVAR